MSGAAVAPDAAAVAAAAAQKVTDDAAAAAAAAVKPDAAALAAAAAAQKVTDDAAAAAAAALAKPKAPEKYALTLPEGGLADQADVDAIAAIARTKDWTNEEAQAALADHATALKTQSDRFLVDLQAHTEIGGAALAVSQQRANAVLDRFLPATSSEGQTLRSQLNKSGYSNYAPLVLLLARIGKAMSEDKPLDTPASRLEGAKDAATVLYGATSAAKE